jgi:hypothetical protein
VASRVRLAIVLTLACAAPAAAHPAPFSYLDLRLLDPRIDGALVVHVFDAAHELDIEPPNRLLDPQLAMAAQPRLVAILERRLALEADGRPVTPQWDGLAVLADRQGLQLRFHIPIAMPGRLVIRAHLFPYDPNHQTFLNIYERGTLRQQVIIDRGSAERVYYAGTVQGTLAVVRTFVPAGIRHILIGPDHILFLVGLLLLGGGFWPLLRIVTAFTVAHSATLSLAALGILMPPPRIIEPAIALSIVFVGADNLLVGESGRDVRAWVALGFGLVHGFGFANVLREFGLPREALGWSLFSFNIGVEIGQLLVVAVMATLLQLVWRRSETIGRRLAIAGSMGVIAAGAYWFIQRVFFAGGVS